MVIGTQVISSSKSGREVASTPSAEITHPHKSVLEPFLKDLTCKTSSSAQENQ